MEITSKEFFINLKSLPPESSPEFKQLIAWEEEKIKGGVTINGVFISGWLYWHLNHWWIFSDVIDQHGNEVRKEMNPILRDNEWIRAEALEQCRQAKLGYMEIGARQTGKALRDDQRLHTEHGYIPIGQVTPGTKIYDDQGVLTTITGVYPQGIRPVYRITLLDGRAVYADEDHKWAVLNRHHKKPKVEVKTTAELLPNYKSTRQDRTGRKPTNTYWYALPNNKAVQYSGQTLPVDPYFIGLWLGVGASHELKITTTNPEIVDYLHQFAKSTDLQVTDYGYHDYGISNGIKQGYHKDKNWIIGHFNSLQLFGNKHIPEPYLRSSIEQRLALLQGLMDSAGTVDKHGSVYFSTSNPVLKTQVETLCRSLGIQVITREKPITSKIKAGDSIATKETYTITLNTRLPVFKLSRKLRKGRRKTKYQDYTAIIDIERVEDAETTCITVGNDTHLFLTEDFIVTHNSELEASYFGMNAIMFRNTQNVIVCGNDADLSLMKAKVDFGLKKLWKGLAIPRLDKTWRSNQIRLGYKRADGEDEVWSYIIIRNAKDGHNTEVAAGTTAKSFIMDEVGKYPFIPAYEAAKPAIIGKFGMRAVPILVGTGGSFENGRDAEKFFYNPKSNGFLGHVQADGKETALFLSGEYQYQYKESTTLGDYLTTTKGLVLPPDSDLYNIPMEVANKEKAQKTILAEREEKRKGHDQVAYLKVVMYAPLTPEECFMTVGESIFNARAAKECKAKLVSRGTGADSVWLYHNGTEIRHEKTDKLPISTFPTDTLEDLDAPIQIYEYPVEDAPFGLYVAGVDPYRQGKSEYSTSLGVVYIFKREHNILSERYEDTIVASYAARPDDIQKWQEQARLLIKWYNARTLCENDELSFINYMINAGDGHLLEDQPEWIKEVIPTTKIDRPKGISRSAEKMRLFLHGLAKTYTEEVIHVEKDEDGTLIREHIGMTKIPDPLLLEEIAQYNDLHGNYDRVIAFELALAQARKLDPIVGKVSTLGSPRNTALLSKRSNRGVFNNTRPRKFTTKKRLFIR